MYPLIKDDGSIEFTYHNRIVRIDEKKKLVWVNDFEIPNIKFFGTYNSICRDAVEYFEMNML